jgi:hypothetical protein
VPHGVGRFRGLHPVGAQLHNVAGEDLFAHSAPDYGCGLHRRVRTCRWGQANSSFGQEKLIAFKLALPYLNLNQLNFHSIFLLLYLSQEVKSSSTVSAVIKFSRDLSYIDGKSGIFPSKIRAQSNDFLYEDKLGSYDLIKYGSNLRHNVIIVTSNEELLFVVQTLNSRELKFTEYSPEFNCIDSYIPWYS